MARVRRQVYGVIGIFGAARYGLRTEGNVLVNSWLGGRAEGLMDLGIAAYLSISIPPMQVCRWAAHAPQSVRPCAAARPLSSLG